MLVAAAEARLLAGKHDGPDDDTVPDGATAHDITHNDAAHANDNDASAANIIDAAASDDGANGVDATYDAATYDAATSPGTPGAEHAAARTVVSAVCIS